MLDSVRRPLPLAVLLFAIALSMRVLFVSATPDGDGPFSPFYKGDAGLWYSYAAALVTGQPYQLELGLPFRPPGTAWLLASVWDGRAEGLAAARWTWVLLGALLAPLTTLAAWRLGAGVAACAGGLVAVSSSAMMLAASPNSEAPHALVAVATVGLAGRLVGRPGWLSLGGFGLLLGGGCLLRVEHLALGVAVGGWLMWCWRRTERASWGRIAAQAAVVVVVGAAVITPWQLTASDAVARYDARENPPVPPRALPWTEGAAAELARVPGFARAATQRFVEAATRHRGSDRVDEASFGVLDEAFGFRPCALPTRFLVALYGPLNFRLANGPEADGGFSRAALDAPPLLSGGPSRYPPAWLASLPRGGDLSLDYPPHLQMVVDGYALGLGWIASNPGAFAALAARKLWITWSGVAHGIGGHSLPLGAGGVRRRVDLTIADGPGATLWRAAGVLLLLFGVLRARRRPDAWPWTLWLLIAAGVSMAFFGYARQGAAALPAAAVLWALAVEPLWRGRAPDRVVRAGLAFLAIVVSIEVARFVWPPTIFVDDAPAGAVEPWPVLQYEVREVEVR